MRITAEAIQYASTVDMLEKMFCPPQNFTLRLALTDWSDMPEPNWPP